MNKLYKNRRHPCPIPAHAVVIPDYPLYRATPEGQIYTTYGKTKRMSYRPNGCGYPLVGLVRADGKHMTVMVHRIIASMFVDGDKSLTVNHININKEDCSSANLEWISLSENHKKLHQLRPELAIQTGQRVSKAIVATHPDTLITKRFCSVKEAAIWAGNPTASGNISKAIRSKRLSYGFYWQFA